MTYEEALAFWYGRIDFERKSPKPGDLKLDRMRALLQALGNPHQRLRIVHVAGTKGKGSTAAMLASVLQAAGYRVGLFTSPHLSDVSERIQVDGVAISRDEMAVRLTDIARAVDRMGRTDDPLQIPTFFEIGTALGFLHFECRRVEIAVIEVGLGGRFDSTNVCSPLLSIITNISFDHLAQLGDKLSLIAYEKAGIIKPGRPIITTAEAPGALAAIERVAIERRASFEALGRDFHYECSAGVYGVRKPSVQVRTRRRNWPAMEMGLFGRHQAANAAGVVAAVERLGQIGLTINDSAVSKGLANVVWPARLEVMSAQPLILLDCAHNVASAEALVDTIEESFPVKGQKRLILAVSSDKQVPEMLSVVGPRFNHFYLTRYSNNSRCLAPERVGEMLDAECPGSQWSVFPTALAALQAARTASGPDDLIAISGSVFLAGELRPAIV